MNKTCAQKNRQDQNNTPKPTKFKHGEQPAQKYSKKWACLTGILPLLKFFWRKSNKTRIIIACLGKQKIVKNDGQAFWNQGGIPLRFFKIFSIRGSAPCSFQSTELRVLFALLCDFVLFAKNEAYALSIGIYNQNIFLPWKIFENNCGKKSVSFF